MTANRLSASRRAGASERQLSRVFHALADPTRRAVIAKLSHSPASMTELARPFRMALPSFAQHLSVLEKCGVVQSRKDGRVRRYRLVPQPLSFVEDWMVAQRAIWEQRLDQLEEYIETMKREAR
ncbi:MAG: ArsR/SmtB family transcription factor [Steroidobacteraceae bacterium]